MQQQQTTLTEDIVYVIGATLLLLTAGVFLYSFWQNGLLLASWLSFVGYTFLAILLGASVNVGWLFICFLGTSFDRLFAGCINIIFPSQQKSR